MGRIVDYLFHTNLKEGFLETKEFPSLVTFHPLFQNMEKRVEEVLSIHPNSIYPYQTLGEGMEVPTSDKIVDFVASLEAKPSAKLVEDLLQQKVFQDTIANIIESGIKEFNKKMNPLFEMIQATGLDKQIKTFIQLFLPNFMPKIANFLHETSFGDQSTLTKDLMRVVLHTDFREIKLHQIYH